MMLVHSTLRLASLSLLLASLSVVASETKAADRLVVEANRVAEVSFTSQSEHVDPFNDVQLDVVFDAPSGTSIRVPAFWDGGKVWRVRYASGAVGAHRYRTECSDVRDTGLHRREGVIEVQPYRGDNRLYRHGPIRVAADRRHFEHSDGTPFFWLGDTWWMGLCERMKWPEEFQKLAADRREKGFNVIQIVAGLYPDMPAFDDRGRNEAGFPWEPEYRRIRPEYFDHADERLQYLADHEFVPCIVGAWGYHLPWLGGERMKHHWRYLVARYGALPVVWCVAGEINLPYYLEPGFPQGGETQAANWEEIIRYVRALNWSGRLITAHPTGLPPLSARLMYKDQSLLDFDMLQTGHGGSEVLAPSMRALRASYDAEATMPVLNSEVSYEALLNRIPADVPRMLFWTNMLSGAAGHTYGANGIWQLNRKGQPYGNSPHGGNYGTIPWDEAMHLPGSQQIGHAKRLLERYPWHRFEPHPEWATWSKVNDGSDSTNDPPVNDEFMAPYAAGIADSVRMFYLPKPWPVIVQRLNADKPFVATFFDPITGQSIDLGRVQPDANGTWNAAVPSGVTDDWVLVVEAIKD
jgi:hypothetical protein